MPNFNSILTGIAKTAVEHLSNKNNQPNAPAPNYTQSNMSGGYNNYGQQPYNQPYGQPGQPNASSGYQQGGGYPQAGPPGAGYSQPSGQPSGYPQSGPPGGDYAQPGGGYPPASSQPGGYPQSGPPASGYTQPGGGFGGYLPQGDASAPYPPASSAQMPIGFNVASGAGYPPAQPGYPPASQPGYPPSSQQPGYPPAQTGYPPASQPGYAPNSGYPPAGGQYGAPQGYPPQGGYPQQPGGYGNVYGTYSADSVQHQYGGGMAGPPSYHSQHPAAMQSNPSLRPYPHFNAQQDAEMLRNAMKGLGCNNSKVVHVLCQRTNLQRQEIAKAFKTMYGKDLIQNLKSELSGDFEDLVLALMEPQVKYDADQLYKAMARIGTRENVLIEVMTTRSNAQIQQLKATYKQIYGKELEDHLCSETSGWFKRLLISMCAGGRDESFNTDPLRANQDARGLYRAGEQRLGTDEAAFNAILAAQNFAQLRLVFQEYVRHTGHTIEQAIQTEFSGDIRDALLAVVSAIQNRAGYFAGLLNDSMKGLGTRDTDLIRIIVTRSEVDLADIRNEYNRLFGKSLESAIAGDCSGSYKDGLIQLVRGN